MEPCNVCGGPASTRLTARTTDGRELSGVEQWACDRHIDRIIHTLEMNLIGSGCTVALQRLNAYAERATNRPSGAV